MVRLGYRFFREMGAATIHQPWPKVAMNCAIVDHEHPWASLGSGYWDRRHCAL
jgi:hypothetical protein